MPQHYISKMRKALAIFFALGLFTMEAGAKIWLPGLFSDNMLLQQKSDICISGRAEGKTITVTPSWSGQNISVAITKGRFSVVLHTPEASYENHRIVLQDSNSTRTLQNVLVGDVWVCSGQSNMEMTMRGFSQQPVKGALEAIMESGRYRDRIRILRVGRYESETERTTIKGKWEKAIPESVIQTSALAYFYARHLNDAVDIPIGIITAARSSSHIEAWMPKDILANEFGYDVEKINSDPNIRSIAKCSLYYNGMIAPISSYPAKGFLWYQGESNRDAAERYPALLSAMVGHWRKIWQNPQMPFIYVQIAPFAYNNDCEATTVPVFVEAQLAAIDKIPGSAIVATTDLGEQNCIHPSDKQIVGMRASVEAMRLAYGVNLSDASGMKVSTCKVSGCAVEVSFTNASYGLIPMSGNIDGFELAGEDGIFHKAEAVAVKGKPTVSVTCRDVPTPRTIRYAYHNFPSCNLRNNLGYPAYPFQRDFRAPDVK